MNVIVIKPPPKLKLFLSTCLLFGLFALIVVDARQHFDPNLIQLKKKHHSAQRNWNLFFGQSNVYLSGGFRYAEELKQLEGVLEADVAVFTDLATSYYLSSSLPVYVKNVHAHHGRYKSPEWHAFINKRIGCYINHADNFDKFAHLLEAEERLATRRDVPPVRYVVINKDSDNINLRRDCFLRRASALSEVLSASYEKIHEGDMFVVFRLTAFAAQSD